MKKSITRKISEKGPFTTFHGNVFLSSLWLQPPLLSLTAFLLTQHWLARAFLINVGRGLLLVGFSFSRIFCLICIGHFSLPRCERKPVLPKGRNFVLVCMGNYAVGPKALHPKASMLPQSYSPISPSTSQLTVSPPSFPVWNMHAFVLAPEAPHLGCCASFVKMDILFPLQPFISELPSPSSTEPY